MATTKLLTPLGPFSEQQQHNSLVIKGSKTTFMLSQQYSFAFKGIDRRLVPFGLQCKCTLDSVGIESHEQKAEGYRPAVILPGLGNNSGDYLQLASLLEAKGVRTAVAKVSRLDWLRNAAGLIDGNYWRGTLRPRPVLDWYLERIEKAISEACLLANGGKLSLIGHSAGGWLARVYLAEFGGDGISLVLTLGTPHVPPPKGVFGVIDQTRGLLDYVERHCPIAYHSPHLKYVCVAGRYVKGKRLFRNKTTEMPIGDVESIASVNGDIIFDSDQGTTNTLGEVIHVKKVNNSTFATLGTYIVGQGYKQVCGQADVWGDGIVPEISAHLEGATNITLEGVYHSPVGSDDILRPWYGSTKVLDKWVHHLLD